MKPSAALHYKRDLIYALTERFRTTNPRVFGSVVRASDKDGSDLDLLVDPLPGTTLFDLGALQVELEELLQVHVDVLTPEDLPPRIRAQIIAEARPL